MKNSFAALILVVFACLLLSPDLARAAASDEVESVTLLSYSELVELPLEKRTQYIEGVRAVLIDLAKRSDGKFSDRDPASKSRLKAWLEMLDRDMKVARAEEVAPLSPEQRRAMTLKLNPPAVAAPSTVDESGSKALRSLFTGAPPQPPSELSTFIKIGESETISSFVGKANLDVRQFKCISVNRMESVPGAHGLPACSNSVEAQIQKRFDDGKAALASREPPPTQERPLTRGLSIGGATVTGQAPANLPAQADIREPAPPVAAPIQPIQLKPLAAPPTAPLASTAAPPEVVVSRRIPFSEMRPYLDRKENPSKLCEAEAKKAGSGPMELVSIDGIQDRYCMTKAAEARYKAADLQLDDGGIAANPTAQARPLASTHTEVAGHGDERKYSCAPKPTVCEVPKTAAAKIFKGGQTCIFAGMISAFNSGNTRCQPQTEFTLGSKKYSCASGQTMCNPLLFGTVNAETAICIGRAPNATEQCAKLSSSRDAEKFLNRSENGLQEKWNDLRKALAETCKANSDSAKFHCEECNIMKTRIFDLHARLVANPCRGGRSDDGEHAVDLRIKLGGPKSSGTKR